ncbi:phosphatidylethanolamine-binding protein 4 isoform X3 [Dendropsophus ebraccatus]|uniref:phosphatidylethanolamine-binding protein 4 isoform X3 n=1 Tax=Dendropsophus ebraccatus TaxID=150705 RepID=UPI0038313167
MWHLCFLQVTMWQALLLTGHLLSVGLFSVVRASCDPQPITGEDAEFCSDDLQVEYGSLGDMSCQKVTLCENVIQYLKEAPQFTYSKAQEDKVYVLIMVDPDAPSREDPIRGPWRHWLVADIQQFSLTEGNLLQIQVMFTPALETSATDYVLSDRTLGLSALLLNQINRHLGRT